MSAWSIAILDKVRKEYSLHRIVEGLSGCRMPNIKGTCDNPCHTCETVDVDAQMEYLYMGLQVECRGLCLSYTKSAEGICSKHGRKVVSSRSLFGLAFDDSNKQ